MNIKQDTQANELFILSPEAKQAIINYFITHPTITELSRSDCQKKHIEIPSTIVKIIKTQNNYYALYNSYTKLSQPKHHQKRITILRVPPKNRLAFYNIHKGKELSEQEVKYLLKSELSKESKTSKTSLRLQLNPNIAQQKLANKRNTPNH